MTFQSISHFIYPYLASEDRDEVRRLSRFSKEKSELNVLIITSLGHEWINQIHSLNLRPESGKRVVEKLTKIPPDERELFLDQIRSLNLSPELTEFTLRILIDYPLQQRNRYIDHIRSLKIPQHVNVQEMEDASSNITALMPLYQPENSDLVDAIVSLNVLPGMVDRAIWILRMFCPLERAHFVRDIRSLGLAQEEVYRCMYLLKGFSREDRRSFIHNIISLQMPQGSILILEELPWIAVAEWGDYVRHVNAMNIATHAYCLRAFSNLSREARDRFTRIFSGQNDAVIRENLYKMLKVGASQDLPEMLSPLTLYLSQLSTDPSIVLHRLWSTAVGYQERIPPISYQYSPAIDGGGVLRDFITKLFDAISLSTQQAVPLQTVTPAANGSLPMIEMNEHALEEIDQRVCYRSIGLLFGTALRDERNLKIGAHFSLGLFAMLHSLSKDELTQLIEISNLESIPVPIQEKLRKVYLKTNYAPYFGENLSEEALNLAIDNLVDRYETTPYMKEHFDFHDGQEEVEQFFKDEKITPILYATCQIAKGMRKIATIADDWDTLKGATPEDLMREIEGELDKEKVIETLRQNNLQSPAREFLIRWIEEGDEEQLKNLLWAMTGAKALSLELTINVLAMPNNSIPLPIFRTCFNQINLYNYPTYELFKSKLEESLFNALHSNMTLT